jgi:outer membrane autotransporter protein
VRTTGSSSPGLRLYAGAISAQGPAPTATITVVNSGVIKTTGSSSYAIDAATFCDPCSINITNNNGGQIIATGYPYTAIRAFTNGVPGPVNITNNLGGLIQGNVQLYGSADTFVNSGRWVMQGNSYFGGAGNNVLNNTATGVITMLDRGPPSWGGDSSNSGSWSSGQGSSILLAGSAKHWDDAAIAGAKVDSSAIGTYYQSGRILTGEGNYFGCITCEDDKKHHRRHDRVETYLFHTVFLYGKQDIFTVTNAGLISMKDGYSNQQIVVAGNFVGAGGTLQVDAFLGKPGSHSDILTVAGNFSGTTHVAVHDTNPGFGFYNPIGIPVIIVGGTDTAVVDLVGGPIIKGLFDYDIYRNADKNVWVLASTPGTAANELPRLRRAATDVWQQSSGVWADRSADLRGYFAAAPQPACDPRLITKAPCVAAPSPSSIGPGVWARAFGDWSHNGGTAYEAPPGNLSGVTHAQDVTYKQDTYGVQVGFDFAAQKTGYENFLFGFMAGAVDSKVSFASGTSAKFSGGNLGAYATLLNGGLFADALVMASFLNMNYTHSTLLSDSGANVVSVGGHFDVGYRFNFGGGYTEPAPMYTKGPAPAPARRWNWFVEPLATVEAIWTEFNKFDLPNSGVGVDLNTANLDMRGRIGARIGGTWVSSGFRWEPSLTLSLWHNFTGDNLVDLTGVCDCFTLTLADANSHLTYGEVGLALSVLELGSRWSAFVKGDYRFAGSDYYGGSVKLGARFQW